MPEETTKEVSPELTQSVADSNFKTIAEAAGFFTAQGYRDAISHSKNIDALREAALAKSLERMTTTDPVEAKGIQQVLSGNALSEKMAELSAGLASVQALIKAAQTTPPPTAKPVE